MADKSKVGKSKSRSSGREKGKKKRKVIGNPNYICECPGFLRIATIAIGLAAMISWAVVFNKHKQTVEGLSKNIFNIIYLFTIAGVLVVSFVLLLAVIFFFKEEWIHPINRWTHLILAFALLIAIGLGCFGLYKFHADYYKGIIEKHGMGFAPNALIAGSISLGLSFINFIIYLVAVKIIGGDEWDE